MTKKSPSLSDPREAVFAHCLEELVAMHGHFTCELSFSAVVVLIGQLQLALRHPANTGESARHTRTMLRLCNDCQREYEAAAVGMDDAKGGA